MPLRQRFSNTLTHVLMSKQGFLFREVAIHLTIQHTAEHQRLEQDRLRVLLHRPVVIEPEKHGRHADRLVRIAFVKILRDDAQIPAFGRFHPVRPGHQIGFDDVPVSVQDVVFEETIRRQG